MVRTSLALLVILAGCALFEDDPPEGQNPGEADSDDTGDSSGADDTGSEAPSNILVNGGFELGETWWRPSGYANHAWSRTGDQIHQSTATFSAYEGEYAQKVWGFYDGEVPNESEHGLTLVDLTAGDTHRVSARVLTPTDDAVSGGNEARLFLRYLDEHGGVLTQVVSETIDADTPPDAWHLLELEAEVPDGTST
ncbi:MAG: hypothetical protein QGG40_12380, partial [Myxococcota bacterium]|nr:hypothetical protein [Myxococcota bacterium]